MRSAKSSGLLVLAALLGSLALAAGPVPGKVGYIPFAEAKPILEAMAEALPAGLSGQTPEKLESLWLDGTQIGDSALDPVKELRMLKVLSLKNTQVSDAGIAELERALPDLSVGR